MAKKQMSWKTKGMNRDLSVSAFNPEFSFENMNLRLSTNEGNTMMSWVTEKGTAPIDVVMGQGDHVDYITGIPIGTAVIDHRLVLFTTTKRHNDSSGDDYIYVIYKVTTANPPYFQCNLYYSGNLNFDADHPLQTLALYESEYIQKVYWVDGKNQLRMVNIYGSAITNNDNQFDILPTLQLNESVVIDKIIGGSGLFAAGVIQYAFTYYRKNSYESNIFYVTPLTYISPEDRGGAPDEIISNIFKITIDNTDDTNFDYLRIYSIHRTSLNGVPICKRVADIDLSGVYNHSITYYDNGLTGDVVDPTELLYKNRRCVIPETLAQKDNTLFLGNITEAVKGKPTISSSEYSLKAEYNYRYLKENKTSDYDYVNQLSAKNWIKDDNDQYIIGEAGVPCSCFKIGNTYRLALQFQDKYGTWTDPVYLRDYQMPAINLGTTEDPDLHYHADITIQDGKKILRLPRIQCTIKHNRTIQLKNGLGFKKVRPLIVFPTIRDRENTCQTVVCPTVFTDNDRTTEKTLLGQSSWFFRPIIENSTEDNPYLSGVVASPKADFYTDTIGTEPNIHVLSVYIPYTKRRNSYNPIADYGEGTSTSYIKRPNHIRQVEVEGYFEDANRFKVDWNLLTFHSPDIDFDSSLTTYDFESSQYGEVGKAVFNKTLSDISIQTDTPVIATDASGFVHKQFNSNGPFGIISGLFYEDFCIDEWNSGNTVGKCQETHSPYAWMVYPWQRTGSLNNDINRPSGTGIASSVLKKKVISNLRFTDTHWFDSAGSYNAFVYSPQMYLADNSVLKVNYDITNDGGTTYQTIDAKIYSGEVDTLLNPDKGSALFYGFGDDSHATTGSHYGDYDIDTPFNSNNLWRLFAEYDSNDRTQRHGIEHWETQNSITKWFRKDASDNYFNQTIGETYQDLVLSKDSVRMRYKSSPHLISYVRNRYDTGTTDTLFYLPIVDIKKNSVINQYGGNTDGALKENIWIIAGKEVPLGNHDSSDPDEVNTHVNFSYGDMYFQRYDCLKTYPYSFDDVNQVVEIGSFMLETYQNIDGRYDKNRGQINNLNMSPQNFNLYNPVYSQPNNFFNYKITEVPLWTEVGYNNYITWSNNKTNGETIDQWTSFTLANTLELEGTKGEVTALCKFNDELLAFQENAISRIKYNDNVQIASTTGVPIEIANSGKVDGYRYLSDSIGCTNKWSIVNTPSGLYFMDNISRNIYLYNGQFVNLSNLKGFNAWSKLNIDFVSSKWTPLFEAYHENGSSLGSDEASPFVGYYDELNRDVLYINGNVALAWNEVTEAFTSFYNYEGTPYFCNIGDDRLWIRNLEVDTTKCCKLWQHQAGGYCNFFGTLKSYWMTLIGNPEPQTDKIFTNLEFRANVAGDGELNNITDKFTPILPFDSMEVWDEYQHGYSALDNLIGHSAMQHGNSQSALKRKFRIWRTDIPRNNVILDDDRLIGVNYPYATDAELKISRYTVKPNDRIRNPWLYMKLKKNPAINRQSFTTKTTLKYWYEQSQIWLNYEMYVIPFSVFENLFAMGVAEVTLNATSASNNRLSWAGANLTTLEMIRIPASQYYMTVPSSITPTLINTWKQQAWSEDEEIDAICVYPVSLTSESDYIYIEAEYTSKTEIHDLSLTYYN